MPGWRCALTVALALTLAALSAQPSRISRAIDNRQRVTLAGNMHPKARPEFDRGRVSPALQLSRVTLLLAPTDKQKADLTQLLAEQQDPSSPNYHRWLTPEQFAQRFGISDADIAAITSWLTSQGLTVDGVARGRTWIAASGSAAQFETAFQTEIHQFLVDRQMQYSNVSEPTIPAALQGVVVSIHGLNNFRMKPMIRVPRDTPTSTSPATSGAPRYTSSRGSHYLSPDDLAIIYNIKPLHNSGVDGSGQSIVVAGQTQLDITDIQQFRSKFNLPAKDPQTLLVPRSADPGVVKDEVAEADLDIEWSGAVARNANIIFVYSSDVMQSVQYAIDQNLAPVVSTSYGLCEAEMPRSEISQLAATAQQGSAQGITWLAASGDGGGPDCADSAHPGLSVDVPASIPEVTGVGGTEFVEGSGQYWNSTNDANGASVLSYLPETTWNDSAADGQPSASGGGASTVFLKPAWQTGPGVPSDNARHVPDVSLSASADHDGYLVITGGAQHVFGGTSVPAPAFAGIAALLNQYVVSSGAQSSPGLGSINPKLYALAQSASGAFHDVTTGDNIATVACKGRSAFCTPNGVGFSAGPGYDQATGLGSVDVAQLAAAWTGSSTTSPRAVDTVSLIATPTRVASNGTVFLTAVITAADGSTPSGNVNFTNGLFVLGSASLAGSAGTATATLAVQASQLAGSGTLSAQFTPPNASAAISASVGVTVTGTTTASPAITGLTNAASYEQRYAPGMILSVFGSQLASSPESASSLPLPFSIGGVAATINGVAAPLYFVSPGQLNIQIPYETPASGTVTLAINNNGNVVSKSFNMSATAPGIFADGSGALVPSATARRGDAISLYLTGYGAVSPAISTGAAPASTVALSNLPRPLQNASLTLGSAPVSILFIGVPPGLAGVLQINFVVPNNAPLGSQTISVSMGGAQSTPVKLTITN